MGELQPSRLIGGYFLLVIIFAFACWQFSEILQPNCQSTYRSAYIPQESGFFEEQWSLSDIYSSSHETAVNLAANDDHLVLFGSRSACFNPSILMINPESGEIEVNTSLRFPAHGGINHISSDSEFVYLGFNGPGKAIDSSTAGAGGVVAYGFASERFEWTKHIPGTRGMRYLAAGRGTIVVDGGGFSRRYYLLDSENGEVIETLEKDIELGFVSNAFWLTQMNLIENISSVDSLEFWQEKLVDVDQQPLLLDTRIIVRNKSSSGTGQVKVLDRRTGEILWETENYVISNIVANESLVFFLTQSAELVALDIDSGKMIGSVKFSGQEIKQEDGLAFFVAANREQVFVYLGDSRQLIAFSIAQSN